MIKNQKKRAVHEQEGQRHSWNTPHAWHGIKKPIGELSMNELSHGIFEDATKANLEQLVGKIMSLAVEGGYYEFVPGFYLVDREYLIGYQKNQPDNLLVKNKDFTTAPFYIMQIEAIKPCSNPLNIAEIILMQGNGNEAED